MLYALDKKREKIRAMANSNAICPNCNEEVISKCGEINMWHWSHKSLGECNWFSDGETYWHIKWKLLVKPYFCEVQLKGHRADIMTPIYVVELQNSPISPKEIIERETNYKNMIWLFNGNNFIENFCVYPKDNYFSFKWKWPRKSITYCQKKVFFDFGEEIFEVKRFHKEGRRGWGILWTKDKFVNIYLKSILREDYNE